MTNCRHCGQMAGTGRYCGNCGIAQHMGVQDPGTAPPAQLLWQALPIGLKLQGRYTVLGLLNRGSFGAVYEVEDERFAGQRRALKELVPVALEAEEFAESRRWFLREGEILGELNHPSIPRIWDSFEDNNRLYIVMQFIEGATLEHVVNNQLGRGLPVQQVLEWATALCDVLEYLHGHQPPVLFRDLKPENIMLDAAGRVVLIDFGIATRFAPQRIGTTIGTPGYAPGTVSRIVGAAQRSVCACGNLAPAADRPGSYEGTAF